MENLKKLLSEESHYRPSEAVMDLFLSKMTEVRLKNKEALIPYGKLDTNVYILKEGIVRMLYHEGENDRTHAFALPGTMLLSWHSYYMRYPAFMQLEACTDSTLMKISKKEFDDLIESSPEFAQWILSISMIQLYTYERRLSVISGSAKERFIGLITDRPILMEKVSQGIIASYLGITQSYLSSLKKQLLYKDTEK